MSVLIKGMEMPKNCWNCPFFHTSLHHIGDDELLERYTCLRTGERTDKNVTGYMKNCPLIELPPHGRTVRWIPVTERLPEGGVYVLAYSADDDYMCVEARHKFAAFQITHWMPLPEPPKEEENVSAD